LKADHEARTLLADLQAEPVDDPLTALSHLAGQIVAWQKAVAALVNRLGEDSIRYEGNTGAEQLRAEIGMYERAMDRAGKVLADIARLDIDARLARIEEEKARVLMEAVQAGLAAISVTPEQAATVKKVMARHLRAVK
jgi:dephospho-CoA kinase